MDEPERVRPLPVSASGPIRGTLVSRAARALWRFVSDPSYRSMKRLALFRGGAFQAANLTRGNRYPTIFAFVRSRLGADFSGRILSFGCSTGEEVITLRLYFPGAFIKGIDINARNVAVFRKWLARMPDPRVAVECTGSTEGEDAGSYDAIFCMAVLRDSALAAHDVQDCARIFPFTRFANTVGDFARCLRPGGLLVIRHSNFRLCDAPAGAAFETVLNEPYQSQYGSPIYGPDNRLMPGVVYEDAVFRKKPDATVP
jgi:SAM-dependent methyltransferase